MSARCRVAATLNGSGIDGLRSVGKVSESVSLDLSGSPTSLLSRVFKSIANKSSGINILRYLNNFVLILCNGRGSLGQYSLEDVLLCLKPALVSDIKEVRAACIRVLRYLINDAKSVSLLLKLHLDSFIVKCLDISHFNEVERIQCLRLIRKIFLIAKTERQRESGHSVRIIPKSFAHCILSISADGAAERDRVYRTCLAILCELIVLEPLLVIENGGILILLRGILECHMYRRINEALCLSLGILLNHPASRNLLTLEFDFSAIFAPYTDNMYRLHADVEDSQLKEEKEMRFSASKMAVVSVLRSWSGLLHLCQSKALNSFIQTLSTPYAGIKRATMSVLFEVFCMTEPSNYNDFSSALTSIGPKVYHESWQLTNHFIVGEGKWFLCSLCDERLDLTNCYMAVLLAVFIQSNVIQRLVDVMMNSDEESSISASIFLGGLLNLSDQLQIAESMSEVSSGLSSSEESLPELIEKAISQTTSKKQKLQAGIAINRLQRIHKFMKSFPVAYSSYFYELILRTRVSRATVDEGESSMLSLLTIHNGRIRGSEVSSHDHIYKRSRSIPIVRNFSSEQTVSRIRETRVLTEKDYQNWNWDAILSFLVEGWTKRADTLKKEQKFTELDDMELHFVKRLVSFYNPVDGEFSKTDPTRHDDDVKDLNVQCGCHLVRLLSLCACEGIKIIAMFLQDILAYLTRFVIETDGMKKATSNCLSSCAREYYLLLGAITMWDHGNDILEKIGVYNFFMTLANPSTHESLIKLVVSSLSYSNESPSFLFLRKALISCNERARFYTTSYLRILLRTSTPGFISWGTNLLVTQLYDPSQNVANEALDIVAEACSNQDFLDIIVKLRPSLLHLGERGALLVCRFASHPVGFLYLLNGSDYLNKELERWWDSANERYVLRVEEMLNQSLTCFEKTYQQGGFIRRSGIKKVVQKVHVPPHLYGELCQHQNGCDLLVEHNIVQRLLVKLENGLLLHDNLSSCIPTNNFCLISYNIISEQLRVIKSCLWALCHIGSSSLGLKLIMSRDVLNVIIGLAEHSPVYSIRGTCFYCLSILSQTIPGTEVLRKLGWRSTLHRARHGNKNVDIVDAQELKFPFVADGLSHKSSLSAISILSRDITSVDSAAMKISSISCFHDSAKRLYSSKASLIDPISEHSSSIEDRKIVRDSKVVSCSVCLEAAFCYECGCLNHQNYCKTTAEQRKFVAPSSALHKNDNCMVPSMFLNNEERICSSVVEKSWYFNTYEDVQSSHSGIKFFQCEGIVPKLANLPFIDYVPLEISKSLQEVIENSMVFVGVAIPSSINWILQPETPIGNTDIPLLHLLKHKTQKRFSSKLDNYFTHPADTKTPTSLANMHKVDFFDSMMHTEVGCAESLSQEILKLVTNLGNSFGNKADETSLLILKEKFPNSFNSVTLYYAISKILSEYSFRLTSRRFVQELFHDVIFNDLYFEAKYVLKKFDSC